MSGMSYQDRTETSSVISEQSQTVCPQTDQCDPALTSPTLSSFVFCPVRSCLILCGQRH